MEVVCTWMLMIAFAAAVLYGIEVQREEEMEEEKWKSLK